VRESNKNNGLLVNHSPYILITWNYHIALGLKRVYTYTGD